MGIEKEQFNLRGLTMLLKNGKILVDGQLVQKDILIENGRISQIADHIETGVEKILDLGGKFVSPGFIDVHVHWREPGFTYKETIKTGSQAAARGGFTTAMPMPNLNPVPDTKQNLQLQLDIIAEDAVIRAIPYGAITKGEMGEELADFADLAELGCFAFTDDGRGVQTANMMYQAMLQAAKLNKAVVAHCEDNSLILGGCMHHGTRSEQLGLPGIPSVCESVQIARDILLAEAAGCHYHVCHVSTKESVRLIRDAKRAGIKVTAEVCPHHLLCNDMDIPEDNGLWKMNPPLRASEDQKALIEALEDGTIEMIATDHAPHTCEEKEISMTKAAFGIVGSETAFPQLYTAFVKTGRWTLQQLVDWLSLRPAQIFNLPYGKLEQGGYADLTVIDLEKEMAIDKHQFKSKGRNTPFNGQVLYGWPVLTLSEGRIAYQDQEWKDGQ